MSRKRTKEKADKANPVDEASKNTGWMISLSSADRKSMLVSLPALFSSDGNERKMLSIRRSTQTLLTSAEEGMGVGIL